MYSNQIDTINTSQVAFLGIVDKVYVTKSRRIRVKEKLSLFDWIAIRYFIQGYFEIGIWAIWICSLNIKIALTGILI